MITTKTMTVVPSRREDESAAEYYVRIVDYHRKLLRGYHVFRDGEPVFKPRAMDEGDWRTWSIDERVIMRMTKIGDVFVSPNKHWSMMARNLCWRGYFKLLYAKHYRRIK